MVHLLGSVLIILSAFFATASAVLYGVFFPWHQHREGWHLFSYMAVIGAATALWAGRLITSGQVRAMDIDEPGAWPFVRLIVFAAITVVLGWRFLIIVGARRDQHRDRAEKRLE